jgi:Anti-sigma-D factor RsdA to sigma factor binding region
MREFGYSFAEQPALDELARTDLLLDALAERQPVDRGESSDPHEDALAVLLGDWRDDLRWPPASALVAPEDAVEALRAGIAEKQRTRRGLAAIGSVAASLLALSGFGAVVAEARPGDTLYGLHAMFFDERHVNEDQITLSAKADLAKVQQMIDQGQWVQAENQLAEVSSTVESMNEGDRRQDLLDQVNLLSTRVESRDPNAIVPPSALPSPKLSVPAVAPSVPASKAPKPGSKPGAKSPSAPGASVAPSAPAQIPPAPDAPPGRHHHHGQTESPVAPTPGP